MRWFVVLGLLFAAAVSPASAADLGGDNRISYKDEVPFAPRFNWTGGYAGLQFGWAWSDTDARSGPLAAFDQTYGYADDGFIGGGHVGYNFQAGDIVYGIEADLEFADINGSGIGTLGNTHQTDIDWMGSVRARLGYAADRTLLYVTGGWAFADVNIRSESGALSNTDTRNGWTLGGGFEHAFSNNMTARLEYRYTDFGGDFVRNLTTGLKDDSDVVVQAVRAGVSIKF